MSPVELVAFAFRALAGHRARSGLSLLGVAVGISAVVVLTALGEGARGFVTDQFTSMGTNIVVVVPGHTETTGAMPGFGGVPNDLTLDDARALEREVRELARVSPVVVGEEAVDHRERSRRATVLGATAEMLDIRDMEIAAGSFLPEGSWDRDVPVVALGQDLARELFGADDPLGESVRIGGWRMRVIGVMRTRGTHLGLDLDETAFVPVATGMRLFDKSSLFRIITRVGSHAEIPRAAERVREVLIERHGEEDVTVLTQDSIVAGLSSILGALTLAVAGIGAISLAVAGIGIMNVMLVTVSERTPEVGLFKAIGARRRQVLAIFLAESALISTAGGLLGLGAGWAAVRLLVAAYPVIPAEPPLWSVGGALGLALVVGLFFGLVPAGRATRLDPVQALSRR